MHTSTRPDRLRQKKACFGINMLGRLIDTSGKECTPLKLSVSIKFIEMDDILVAKRIKTLFLVDGLLADTWNISEIEQNTVA
jgi:hypothetical protein